MEFPQTYGSILKDCINNGTLQVILRRKLSKLCKDGTIYKTTIPGTRFGKVVFYGMPKDYHILVESSRISGSVVFVFKDFEKLNRYYIRLKRYWQLVDDKWVEINEEKTIFDGNVLKWI